ncbi:hypothetical protein WN48_11100 [Eufriesea mexicana]|nr:hypothetical protein WN48_11100 [Eufriesea mexicana]
MKIFHEATKRPPDTHASVQFPLVANDPLVARAWRSAVSKDANRGCSLFCPRAARQKYISVHVHHFQIP